MNPSWITDLVIKGTRPPIVLLVTIGWVGVLYSFGGPAEIVMASPDILSALALITGVGSAVRRNRP